MALTLFKRELDVWEPAEHNGTFRGNNPAFVTGRMALEQFWTDDTMQQQTLAKGERIGNAFAALADRYDGVSARGRGMARGLAFDNGLFTETAGPADEVVKLLPALTIANDELDHGLQILAEATDTVSS